MQVPERGVALGKGAREWQSMEAARREFEAVHKTVTELTHPATGQVDFPALARAWTGCEATYRAYAEAYRAFFRAAGGVRR